MLNRDPSARLTADGVCQHPWVQRGAEALGSNAAVQSNKWSEPKAEPAVLEKLATLGMDTGAVSAAVSEKARNELWTAYCARDGI